MPEPLTPEKLDRARLQFRAEAAEWVADVMAVHVSAILQVAESISPGILAGLRAKIEAALSQQHSTLVRSSEQDPVAHLLATERAEALDEAAHRFLLSLTAHSKGK